MLFSFIKSPAAPRAPLLCFRHRPMPNHSHDGSAISGSIRGKICNASTETLALESSRCGSNPAEEHSAPSGERAVHTEAEPFPITGVGSPENNRRKPQKVYTAAGPRKSADQEKPKSRQVKKILATRTARDQPNPDEKLELPDKSPGSKRVGANINDRVSDYIKRAKLRIRTVTMTGGGKAKAEKEPAGPDRFTDYIRRTKNKLRSTLSIGRGR